MNGKQKLKETTSYDIHSDRFVQKGTISTFGNYTFKYSIQERKECLSCHPCVTQNLRRLLTAGKGR